MRNQMTAAEAKEFDGYSERNAAIVADALTCDCEPYEDVYTYDRWQALGRQVVKGQHGIKLSITKAYEIEDKDTGELVTRKRRWYTTVFCKCQTIEKGK